jgi:hypothetical protein
MQEQVGRLVPIPDSCGVLGGIGRTKLYELINDGKLTRVRIGARAFITGESLESFLAGLTGGVVSALDGEAVPDGE